MNNLNRIDRLTAILIQLQTKRFVTAESIAERFCISKRTVYRDVSSLQEAGVPIGGEPGRGYFIVQGYHLPPIMFDRTEALAMLTAKKLVDRFTDNSTREHYSSAIYKIRSVLRDSEKDFLETVEDTMQVMFYKPLQSEEFPNNFLSDIQQAVANNKVLKISYFTAYRNETTEERLVEPVGVCFYSLTWHLIAFCRMRNQLRDFRLDRIKKLMVLDETFANKANFSLENYFDNFHNSSEIELLTVRLSLSAMTFIENSKYYFGLIKENTHADYVELVFAMNDVGYISRWLMTLGKDVLYISSKKVSAYIIQKTEELSKLYL